MKREFLYSDILIWVCFAMMLIVKFMTLAIFSHITVETKAEIEDVANMYEGNDLFKIAMSLGKIGFILGTLIVPGTAMASYYYFRRKCIKGKMDKDSLTFFVQFAFFTLMINIVNDGAVLFGKLV